MNNRIQELITQCTDVESDTFDKEKFADLIINDIYAILDNRRTYNRCTVTTYDLSIAGCVVDQVKLEIKQQFKGN